MTTVFIVSGTSYTVPADWTSTNTVEVIGGGGGGSGGISPGGNVGLGGGGGAYSKISNLTLSPGSSITIQVGSGGAGAIFNTSTVNGGDGGDTWFNGASLAASSVGAKGGTGANDGTFTSGVGGSSASGIGTTKFSGGSGAASSTNSVTGYGGGGAAGPYGAGQNGGLGGGPRTSGGAGGGGAGGGLATAGVAANISGIGGLGQDGGAGGTRATPGNSGLRGSGGGAALATNTGVRANNAGGAGGAGVEWDTTHGAGGGGGGGDTDSVGANQHTGGDGGAAGLYGGGGGGAAWGDTSDGSGGAGAQGIIVLIYTPSGTPAGGARFKQRFNRSPLAYPAGATPGIDPNHPALTGSTRLWCSAVANNGLFVQIAPTCQVASIDTVGTGSYSSRMDGLAGTCIRAGTVGQALTYGFPTSVGGAVPSPLTFAAIVNVQDITTTFQTIMTLGSSSASHAYFYITAGVLELFFSGAGANDAIGISFKVGHSYFVAASSSPAGVNFVSRDLSTGIIQTSSIALGAAVGSFTLSSVTFCNDSFGDTGPNAVACGAAIQNFLSIPQLLQWAADPWSFWYPRPAIQYTTPATATTTGGARFKQRFNRSPLAYPAGAVPGYDPNHVAARNCGFSGVAANGGIFKDILSGRVGSNATGPSTSTTSHYGSLGPVTNYVANVDNTAFPFVNSTTALTLAGIFKITSPFTTNAQYLLATAATGPTGIALTEASTTGAFGFTVGGGAGFDVNGNVVALFEVPYFWAASFNGATVNYVIVRLDTGNIVASGPISNASALIAGDGNIWVGNRGANTRQLGGGIAAAMASNTFMSQQQLMQWAKDPWSFWYPNPTIEYITTAAAAATTIQFGWEPHLPLLPHLFRERRGAIARGDDGTAITKINWFNGGWEIQPPPPPHQPREKRGAILPRDDGNELPKINWFNIGWETQPPPPPHPKVESRGAIMPRDDGNQLPKINWFNGGWEVQPPPPATANRRNARAAILRGDDGTEGVFSSVVILTSGWGFDPNLPLVLRPKRLDASLIGDFGNQSPFILFRPSGFEIAPFQPPHPRSERSGSLMRGDEGAQAGKINFFPAGFEAVWHQPNHPRPERSGAIALGDIGYYAPTATVVTSNWGFDAQSWQPPRQIYRAATLPWGDDGIQSQFILFRPTGFEISPVQPPHPRFEQRAAGFLRGDDGNQDILRSWFNAGWEVAPYQPQHVAYAKAGAIMFGDTGTESVYVFIAPAVGTSTWRTLMGVGI